MGKKQSSMISFGNRNTTTILHQVHQPKLEQAMSKDYAEAMPGIVKGADGENYIETPTSVPFAFQLDGMRGTVSGQYRQLSQQRSLISYQLYR